MSRSFLILASVAFLTGPQATAQERPKEAKADPPVVLKGLDPIDLCGGKETQGRENLTEDRAGFRYRFASEANRDAFRKNPNAYAAQLDGGCAVMPAVKGNPNLFTVHEKKIYLFGSTNCLAEFKANPAKFAAITRRVVAIFIHEGVELLDFAGPGEVFASADNGKAFKVVTVSASKEPVKSQQFLTVTPEYSFDDCPKPDLVVIPGGATQNALKNPKLVEWVKKVSADAEITMSVCTGAFVLGKAGLLDGKEATTHWGAIANLKSMYPNTKIRTDRRIVDNGKVITTAGVSAGIDGALYVVKRLLGEAKAKETAKYMEYQWDSDKN